MNRQQIQEWLDKHNITNYTIYDDLTVDVDDSVNLYAKQLIELPFKFGIVTDHFDIASNKIASLYNCPDYVGGYFDCSLNRLTSFEYCPKYIGEHLYADYSSTLYTPNITSVSELLEIQIEGVIFVNKHRLANDPAYNILKKLGKIG
jgi:hypothetical protein